MKKLILKLALVLMAISLNSVAQDDNCYFKYQKKFDERGAFEVENGWHTDIVVTFRRGLNAECYTAKVEVKEGVIAQIHIRNSDGSYERYTKKFKNNMDQNISIINGISRAAVTVDDEIVNVIFIKHIKPPKKKFESAPSADDL